MYTKAWRQNQAKDNGISRSPRAGFILGTGNGIIGCFSTIGKENNQQDRKYHGMGI
jgi:hypothetical protein